MRVPPLSALEIAYGAALETGAAPARGGFLRPPSTADDVGPRERRRRADAAYRSLADAIRPHLERGPCLVSFSGGMDSSFLLAVAAAVAREDGLPPPVPIVLRFVDAPEADETTRQNQVLAAIDRVGRVGEPLIRIIEDELDLVGPVARRMLRLAGLQVPVNLYSHLPLLDAAAGGTLLTGFGGDQLIGGHGATVRRRSRLLAALPAPAEAALRSRGAAPWLRPPAVREAQARVIARRRWRLLPARQRLVRESGSRFTALAHAGMQTLGAACAAGIAHPLFDAGFLARLADLLDVLPPTRRVALYAMLAGDRLPPVVTEAHPKARLAEVFQRSGSAAAVRAFDPDCLPAEVRRLLDVDELLAAWRSRGPARANALLLHVAALADEGLSISHHQCVEARSDQV